MNTATLMLQLSKPAPNQEDFPDILSITKAKFQVGPTFLLLFILSLSNFYQLDILPASCQINFIIFVFLCKGLKLYSYMLGAKVEKSFNFCGFCSNSGNYIII